VVKAVKVQQLTCVQGGKKWTFRGESWEKQKNTKIGGAPEGADAEKMQPWRGDTCRFGTNYNFINRGRRERSVKVKRDTGKNG